jgi:predicted O-methyltransferase YrrM
VSGVTFDAPKVRVVDQFTGRVTDTVEAQIELLQERQKFNLGPWIKPKPHYALLAHILKQCPPGTGLEFGVATGTSLRLIAAHMPVIGFGSPLGLPEDWRPGFPKGSFACATPFIAGVQVIEGMFEDTLPGFDFDTVGPITLVHLDADLYSSTRTVLEHVGPHLHPGCHVVMDEFRGYPAAEEHEARAWAEYVTQSGTRWEAVGHSHEAAAFRML